MCYWKITFNFCWQVMQGARTLGSPYEFPGTKHLPHKFYLHCVAIFVFRPKEQVMLK